VLPGRAPGHRPHEGLRLGAVRRVWAALGTAALRQQGRGGRAPASAVTRVPARARQAGVLPSGEAVCCVPNTLVALCLNTGGLARVRASRALRCFVPIFTSRQYLRALQVGAAAPARARACRGSRARGVHARGHGGVRLTCACIPAVGRCNEMFVSTGAVLCAPALRSACLAAQRSLRRARACSPWERRGRPPAAAPAPAWARAQADRARLCQWQGDTPSILGSGLDELMRHVAGLRSDGITVVLHILRRLCLLGGLADARAAEFSAECPPATSAAAGADAPASGAETGAQRAGGHETGSGSGATLQAALAAQGERGADADGPGDGGAGAAAAGAAGEAGLSRGSGPVAMQTDGAAAPSSPAAAPAPGGAGGAPAAQPGGSLEAPGWEALAPVAPPVPPPPAAGGGGGGGGGGAPEAPAAGAREGLAAPAAAGAAPPLDLSGEPEPGPAADAGAWLAESVSHAARMLEPLLGTADSAREFMARGGARALLARAPPAPPPAPGLLPGAGVRGARGRLGGAARVD